MKRVALLLLFLVALARCARGESTTSSKTPATTHSATTKPPTTKPPSTKPPTTKPPTTKPPTTKPPTTKPPTTKPPTTKPPKPAPSSPKFVSHAYNVTDNKTGIVCVRFEAAVEFEFHSETKNKSKLIKWAFTNDASVAHVSGDCPHLVDGGAKVSSLNIANSAFNLSFEFTMGNTSWYLSKVGVVVDLALFNKTSGTVTYFNVSRSSETQNVPKGNFLVCESKINQTLKDGNCSATLLMKDLKLQPFDAKSGFASGNSVHCNLDSVLNHNIPIAVGIALGCLIGIVLVVYFIGRSRNQGQYEPLQ
ncbi:LAMP family protein lmp-1-like [Oscarella lobularis]|uniref:LAMP family protein lmp-1-like n=1 Tax=Oscarella lobularis TaxID=121494 RepID=UPI003313291C